MKSTTIIDPSVASDEVVKAAGDRKYDLKDLLRLALIALPVVSLIISAWSWLRYGVDIPVYDDWRQYNANDMGRLDLRYLMTPHNDTLYTVGLLLDSLAFRFLDGNTVAYQFLSMVSVLGGLLVFQWRLLSSCITNKTYLAVAFSFTLLMLQPDTYWGWQNLAYHQAIPLVCLFGILALTVRDRINSTANLLFIAFLTLASGLTYISGAFSSLAMCFIFVFVGLMYKTLYSKNLVSAGLAMSLPALATTMAQLWVIVGVQHGTHRADAPMAYPWESDFWYFMLGKVGRSLMLPMSHPKLSLIITAVAVLMMLVVIVVGIFKLSSNASDSTKKAIIIFLSLSGVVFVYLLLISAGRTNLRPDSVISPADIFIYGFYRFHFFWVTLLWPWLALLCLKVLSSRKPSKSFAIVVTLMALTLWVCAIIFTNIMGNADFYKATMKHRADGLACVVASIQQSGAVRCSNIDLGEISEGIKNGRAADASFARILPILPIALGTDNPPPIYRLTENLATVRVNNAVSNPAAGRGLELKTDNDPGLIITVAPNANLSHCGTVDLTAAMTVEQGSVAQLFYMTPGHVGYSEERSTTAGVSPSKDPQIVSLTINSSDGFESEFRFDPVTANQKISIKDLEIRCRSYFKNN
ncbi:hypothetical protein [Pseudomonas reactans]